jgi:formamidopyrimidine-DNA glycosylase
MPELPEVEHAARTLGEQVQGAVFDGRVDCTWLRTIDSVDPARLGADLAGLQIMGWRRRAKWIVLPLSDGTTLVAHLRMTGRFVVCDQHEPALPQQRVAFGLRDGRDIRFLDQRKFGRIHHYDAIQLAALDAAHGVEPFDEQLTMSRFYALMQRTSRAIKAVLLDQTVLAGVGNIYADEALWRAQIHPLTPANTLAPLQTEMLLNAVQLVLRQGIENGGSTLRDYRDSYGAKGTQQDNFQVYGRTGAPCFRCGAAIIKCVVAQRGTHLCPACQVP